MRRVECEWGIDGAAHLARSCGTIVVIDVLSFSTAVDVATRRGALVFPYGRRDAALDAYAEANLAELAGRRAEWQRGLEGFEMTESQVVNEWISQGEAKGNLERQRQNLLELLEGRFPGAVPDEVVRLIRQQDSLELLHDWFKVAVRASTTIEQFLDVLKK